MLRQSSNAELAKFGTTGHYMLIATRSQTHGSLTIGQRHSERLSTIGYLPAPLLRKLRVVKLFISMLLLLGNSSQDCAAALAPESERGTGIAARQTELQLQLPHVSSAQLLADARGSHVYVTGRPWPHSGGAKTAMEQSVHQRAARDRLWARNTWVHRFPAAASAGAGTSATAGAQVRDLNYTAARSAP